MFRIIIVAVAVASQYALGVMPRTVSNQQGYGHLPTVLPEVDGYVAAVSCAEIGNIVYLRPQGTLRWEKFLIADCSGHAETTRWMITKGIPYELGGETVKRWGDRLNKDLTRGGIIVEIGEQERMYEFQ